MEGQDTTVPLMSGGGPTSAKKKRNRNRNSRQRNATSKSQSPTRESTCTSTGTGSSVEGARSPHPSKSRSPTRRHDKSKSPMRGGASHQSHSPPRNHLRTKPHHHHQHHHHHHHHQRGVPADMTVVCQRSDLWDSAAHFVPDETQGQHHHHHHDVTVLPFSYSPCRYESVHSSPTDNSLSVAIARVPHHLDKADIPIIAAEGQVQAVCDVVDTSIPNPHDPEIVHDKYWAQRRRLFSKFDQGIQLDGQGWYSVTPEIIADHVAQRVGELATKHVIPHENEQGIVILDAFCGCGGNSIAFGKIPSNIISKVVCVDTDRSKLLKAAHNASLYDIPKDKLVFVECNSIFILQHCYKDGQFILDQPTAALPSYMPPPVMPTVHAGYHIGGLDMLPRHIDAVFMDPPWGGVDYEVLGKNGYDLQKNMKIQVGPHVHPPVDEEEEEEEDYEADGDGCDDFFDNFAAPKQKSKISQRTRKENFNKQAEGAHFIDGMELLRIAAEAVSARVVVYDLPRNTNKTSLGKCALGAGYRGNIKLEEHYLNGRLKTVTAYMGADYSETINSLHDHPVSTGNVSSEEG